MLRLLNKYEPLSFISEEWKKWSDSSSKMINYIFWMLKNKQADCLIQTIVSSDKSKQLEEEYKVEVHSSVPDVVYEKEFIIMSIPYQSQVKVKSYEQNINNTISNNQNQKVYITISIKDGLHTCKPKPAHLDSITFQLQNIICL